MARAPGQTCSLCGCTTTLRASKPDGNGGRRCRPGECKTPRVDAADLEAGHAERLAAAGLSTGLAPADRADADAKARVLAKSPPTRASVEKGASARLAAHRVAVLDFLRPKSAGLSFSPGEIARGSGVLLEEVDVVIKALLASGEIEEIDEEEDEDPSYRTKPSAPAPPKPRVNRRGKPAAEAARTCRVCECTVESPCDDGAGRSCCWTSSKTPASGDLCTVCGDAMVLADELLDGGEIPAEVVRRVEEDSAPCVDAARATKIVERVIAARTPTKKTRPTREKKPQACPDRRGEGHCPKHGPTCPLPVQSPIPGLGAARELTLPFAAAPTPTSGGGACEACGAMLTPENTSKLPSGVIVHVGCEVARTARGTNAIPIERREPCEECGARSAEPCAWATPEPASYVHEARMAKLIVEDHRIVRTRAAEDRIRVALDEHAAIPGDPPVPTAEGLVRGLVVPGDFDVFTLRDVLGAMIERGEVTEIRCVTERAGIPGATYLRRAEGGAPVVMGRVGAVASVKPEGDGAYLAQAMVAAGAGERGAHEEGCGCVACLAPMIDSEHADGCDVCGAPATCHGEHDGEETRGCDEHCGHGAEDGRCEPIVSETTAEEAPTAGVAPCEACDPCGGWCDHEGDADPRLAAAPSVRRPVDPGLAVEEPERVGVKQAEGDDGEAGSEGAHAESIAAAPESRKENRHELSAVVTDRPLSPAERLLVALSEAVRAAEEAREAARACLAGEIAQRAAVEQLDAVQRERDEQTAVANALHVELADVRAERDQARANVTGFEEALRTEAYEKDLIARERDEQRAALATAKDLARLASLETADRGEETRAFRGALRSIVEKLGGTAPDEDTDLISEAVALTRRTVSSTPLRGALSDVLGALGAERGADLSDEELGARAVQCAGLFGEAAVNAILDLSGEKPTASKPLAEQLLTAARDYGPRAGSFSTELETEAFASIHRLAGVAPIGEGRAALARALRDAVTAALAKRPAPPTPPPITPIRRPWDMPAEEKENS